MHQILVEGETVLGYVSGTISDHLCVVFVEYYTNI